MLKNKIISFSQVRMLAILTHLWTTYGSLKEEDVQDFDKKLKTAIFADTCFEDFVTQIEPSAHRIPTLPPMLCQSRTRLSTPQGFTP